MALMTLRNISYAYAQGKPVLQNISLQLQEGSVYCIFGPSGCGKTTLLSLMGGLDVPTQGQIFFRSEPLDKIGLQEHRWKNVAFVFQNYNLIDYMTPLENIALVTNREPMNYLKRVGITAAEAKRNVLKLSGGQQQRVAIARALASGAPLILADEPTGNLDEDTANEIIRILKDNAHQLGRCVVIVSHSAAVVAQSDIALRLSRGKLYMANDAPR